MLRAVSLIFRVKLKKLQYVSLTRTAVQRRADDIAENVTNQLHQKAKKFSFCSVDNAVDESSDSTDTAQRLVFVRGIDDKLNAFEEHAGLQSMESQTVEKDVGSEIVDCVITKLNIDFKKLVGLCTDGAPAVCGKRSGSTALLQEHVERNVITHHCIIHQRVLGGKVLDFDLVMSVAFVNLWVEDCKLSSNRKRKHRLVKS